MKSHYTVLAVVLVHLFSSCAQNSTLKLEKRKEESGREKFSRSMKTDPLDEVQYNANIGNFRFFGLVDIKTRQEMVPGLSPKQFNIYEISFYPVDFATDRAQRMKQYFKVYNEAIFLQRKGLNLDAYGQQIKSF